MLWRREKKTEASPLRLLLWTAIAGLAFALCGLNEPPEDLLRVARNGFHRHSASGDIVLVRIDDNSLHQIGRWPWPRRYHAKLTDALTSAGVSRIFFDVLFENASDHAEDRLFAAAIERSKKVTLPVRARSGINDGGTPDSAPLPILRRGAAVGTISARYNYHNSVWKLPYALEVNGQALPSYAAKLASVSGPTSSEFPIDYSLDPTTIPSVSAVDVLRGKIDARRLAGKDVVVGITTDAIGDQYFLPGWGQMGGAFIQISGAETLKAGKPLDLGWIPAFLLSLAASAWTLRRKNPLRDNLILVATAALLLVAPIALETNLIFLDIVPGLFVIATIAAVLARRRFRTGGLVNAISGLPNLSALRTHKAGHDQALIVMRVLNYAEIVSALTPESERQLVEQIVSRLRVGSPDRTLYQGDGGLFAWFEKSRLPVGPHVDALYSLFRSPARVEGMLLDISVSFGIEIGSSRSLTNRLASAIVAAEEAAHDGLKWKYHDPESLQNATWKLSMLTQLDQAIDKGEVWIAYQPKLELSSRQIVGAEALARWTHPEKGPIAASEFVVAAEQHDRIGKLTDFILEKAIAAAAGINKRGYDFSIAVNLSARMLTDKQLAIRTAALLARHGLPPHQLTLELTETAELINCGESLDMLARLRDVGIGISIDDYGTGLSTLDYLKKIPATEIKIDQSFVKGMCDNRSDRLMVQSTIGLAHSLGRKVVAEGVEQRETLDALIDMDCDLAQGFILGRPMSLDSLLRRLSGDRRRRTA